jgi:gluconokinase
MAKVILAIDIGSSSVRCSAYTLIESQSDSMVSDEGPSVQALENCRAHRPVRSVEPNTGKIQLMGDSKDKKSLMENLDECIDELLENIRKSDLGPCQVVAVGFSAFVMNLVGVDAEGSIVGDEASVSYACNAPAVAKQCQNLRM